MPLSFALDIKCAPMFDSLVQYQLGNGDVYMYFLAFVGRLFYTANVFDNFDVVLGFLAVQ